MSHRAYPSMLLFFPPYAKIVCGAGAVPMTAVLARALALVFVAFAVFVGAVGVVVTPLAGELKKVVCLPTVRPVLNMM